MKYQKTADMRRRAFSLAEVLISASVATMVLGAAVLFYWSTFRHARKLQSGMDRDFQVHKMLQRIRTDLAISSPQGALFQADARAFFIRQLAIPDANGSPWGGLCAYRLNGQILTRHQVATLAGLGTDQAFPADPASLTSVWGTSSTFSAPEISDFQVVSTGQALNIEVKSGTQTYRTRMDFQL